MKNTTSVCSKRYKRGAIKCSVELMPGKGGGEGTKPIVYEIGAVAKKWMKRQDVEDNDGLDK